MYPLNVTMPAPALGFALANDDAEHRLLSDAGYLPAYAEEADDARTPLLAQAAEKGLKVDRRWSDARLADELAKLDTAA